MKSWKWLKPVLIIVICGVLIFIGANVSHYVIDGINSGNKNKTVAQAYHAQEQPQGFNAPATQAPVLIIPDEQVPVAFPEYHQKYQTLLGMNEDAVGWLSIEGTNVDYPVLQADDNEYYRDHDIEGDESVRGSIFMDMRNESSDDHIIIYGHNMKDGSMFGQIEKYQDETYYRDRSIIVYNNAGTPTRWEIFSVYVCDDEAFRVEFGNTLDFMVYLDALKKEGLYDTGIEVSDDAKILTISTCSDEKYDGRFVVHAKQIEWAE